MPNDDLLWALHCFEPSERRTAYAKCVNYDTREQPMAFATEKFRSTFFQTFKGYKENMCSAVVDALSDRLSVSGFKSTEATVVKDQVASSIAGVPPRPRVQVEDPLSQDA